MKKKSFWIIIATFLLGGLIGFLITGAITKRKLDHFRQLGTARGFSAHALGMIKPEGPNKEKIEELVDHYSERHHELMTEHIAQMESMLDSMRSELAPLLTDKQKRRMEQIRKFRKRKHRKMRPGAGRRRIFDHRPGRPPHGPPPFHPHFKHGDRDSLLDSIRKEHRERIKELREKIKEQRETLKEFKAKNRGRRAESD